MYKLCAESQKVDHVFFAQVFHGSGVQQFFGAATPGNDAYAHHLYDTAQKKRRKNSPL